MFSKHSTSESAPNLDQWRQAFLEEAQSLLQWWQDQMLDPTKGGCYGRRDAYNRLYPDADKGIILHSRVLWTFATAARQIGNPSYRAIADQMFAYVRDHFLDREYGGVFWMLDQDGQPVNTRKQVYAQAFMIYACSEYYLLTENAEALELAMTIFDLLEHHSRDRQQGGYWEAFSRNWGPLEDLRLSEKDANEAKSMNTHLHVMEAYVNLYRASPNERVQEALKHSIDTVIERFIDVDSGHQTLFFDENWQPKSRAISYGHDIETSWLLWEAIEVLGEESGFAERLVLKMAEATLREGLDQEGGVLNEREGDHLDSDLHWWPQAEAVVGFWNAYQLSGEMRYREAAQKCWQIIQRHLKDTEHGEWHWRVNAQREVLRLDNKAGPWKAPYHNVRMCLEMWRRLGTS
ncbi:MAG: AGE family epimerase/isomerase [Bacteroidota bacterium]